MKDNMNIKYIFNSSGKWVAYIVDENIFLAKTNEWFGWIEDNEVYSPMGEYIGFLYDCGGVLRVARRHIDVPKFNRIAPIPPIPPIPPVPPIPPIPPLLPVGYLDVFDKKQ